MKEKLTRKESKFLQAYLQNKTLADCALAAGSKSVTSASLKSIGWHMLTRINPSLREIQEMNGVTDQSLTETLKDGLQAKKTELAIFKGKICDTIELTDHSNRLKALEIAHRLRGQFIEKLEHTGKGGGDLELVIVPAAQRRNKEIDID